MSYFNECDFCGAALDPGEQCDCERQIIGVDLASGEDVIVAYNPETLERKVIDKDSI